MESKKDSIVHCLSEDLRHILEKVSLKTFETMEEIRIRAAQPLCIKTREKELFLGADGTMAGEPDQSYYPDTKDIMETLEIMSGYSLYAFEEELRNGFITLPGGHRVGITGKAVMEAGEIKTMKNISGMNIRLCHEIKGCGDVLMPYIINCGMPLHTLIVSPPGCGKTTLLRDVIRQLSNGKKGRHRGFNISVVDERSEIAGSYRGVPQNDVGIRTDILDCCPKAKGMTMLLRSMAPDVIAVDEIGGNDEISGIESALNGGIRLICTVHGRSLQEIKNKPVLSELLGKQIFERIVVLSYDHGPGTIRHIYDGAQNILYG